MGKVTIGLADRELVSARFIDAFEKNTQQGIYINFESEQQLWKTLTLKRWEILKVLTGVGTVTIREVARRVDRDVKAVHSDVKALLNTGILDKTEDGKIVFPYDAVHVDFVLKAA